MATKEELPINYPTLILKGFDSGSESVVSIFTDENYKRALTPFEIRKVKNGRSQAFQLKESDIGKEIVIKVEDKRHGLIILRKTIETDVTNHTFDLKRSDIQAGKFDGLSFSEGNQKTEESTSINLLGISDQLFIRLFQENQKDASFRFWLRTKDSNRSEEIRLQNGQWFQGSDYVFVGFSGITDPKNKTQTIGFVAREKNGILETYVELAYPSETRQQYLHCYNKLKGFLKVVFPTNDQSDRKFSGFYEQVDITKNLNNFLEILYPEIQQIIESYGLGKSLEIPKVKFDKALKNTLSIRQDLYPNRPLPEAKKKLFDFKALTIRSDAEELSLNTDIIAHEFAKVVHRSKDVGSLKCRTSQEDRFYGIFGQWGRGKTTFWNEVKKTLTLYKLPWLKLGRMRIGPFGKRGLSEYKFVSFHAWKYQDTPAVWAYLYEKFAAEYYVSLRYKMLWPFSALINAFQSFWLSCYRNPRSIYTFLFSSFVLLLAFKFHWLFTGLEVSFGAVMILTVSTIGGIGFCASGVSAFSKPLVASANRFIKLMSRTSFKIHLGVQHEIQEEFKLLLQSWYPLYREKKLVLFIDDIDRCDEEKIIQIVDSIRVMLDEPEIRKRLIVFAAIDERILCQAIRKKYEKFLSKEHKDGLDIERLTAEYLDKLFIAGIKLNRLSPSNKQEILRNYMSDLVVEEDTGSISVSSDNVEEGTLVEESSNINGTQGEVKSSLGSAALQEARAAKDLLDKALIPKAELTAEEVKMLEEKIVKLQHSTPRLIRGFLIKYRFARNLIRSIEGANEEVSFLEQNRQIADRIIDALNFVPSEESEKNTPGFESRSDDVKAILNMVDYYHHPSVTQGVHGSDNERKIEIGTKNV